MKQNFSIIPSTFFSRAAPQVARDLLGKGLWIKDSQRDFLVELTEVEAYAQENDAACHSYRGMTKRNAAMFAVGGTCYVYLTYGMHLCMNVSTGEEGVGDAVLLRSARPIVGLDSMIDRRGLNGKISEHDTIKKQRAILCGPGRLTAALGITLQDNGRLFGAQGFALVELGGEVDATMIETTSRIGISKATDLPWRFLLRQSEWVSFSFSKSTLTPEEKLIKGKWGPDPY